MDNAVVGFAALLGLVFGSFANVVIHRVPAGESISHPRSACPSCGAPITPRDNIPVLSWVALRGRCRGCGAAISIRYPLVELAGAILFGVVAWRIGPAPVLPGFLVFTWLLLVVSVIDAQTRRIPNALTYPLTPTIAVLIVGGALVGGDPAAAVRALLGGIVGFGFLLLLALVNPRGMGMGDVKLAASIGLVLGYLGWGVLALGLFLAFLFGGVIGIALMALRLRSRRDQIPFGPYLALGAFTALVSGGPLVDAYMATLS